MAASPPQKTRRRPIVDNFTVARDRQRCIKNRIAKLTKMPRLSDTIADNTSPDRQRYLPNPAKEQQEGDSNA
jgi:hypothetical protein